MGELGATTMPCVGIDWGSDELRLTPEVSLLCGTDRGAYPSGNSVLVRGRAETALVDPSVTVVARGGAPVAVDLVLNSHAHEDHVAGNGLFPAARVRVHEADLAGVRSLDGLMDMYGMPAETGQTFAQTIVEEFSFTPRPDAEGFGDGARFDLGGVALEAVHLPGHARGHAGFRIDGGVFFLADIDLSGFGPYYGDAWSDLDDFDESLRRVREEEARWYVTFHHKGVVEGRERFHDMLDAFAAVIDRRHRRMLDFLTEPRSLAEMATHRFVYRPHVEHVFADHVERRTAELHIARMLARGQASEVEPGRYRRL